MSYITIAEGKIKTFQSADGAETVHSQTVVPVDSAGTPVDLATQATLDALKASVDALSAKIIACNTGSVTLDAATIAALENITATISGSVTVENPTAQGLTDAQLRASAVPVSGTFWQGTQPVSGEFYQATQPVSAVSLPLPTGAATETTLSGIDGKLPVLVGGRIPVELPVGGGGLTDAELRASPVPVSGSFSATMSPDNTMALMSALRSLVHPIWEDATSGRLRVVLDPAGGAQTLATVTNVTTVATLSNMTQIGGVPASGFIYDTMHATWASTVRRAVA